jgi:phosphate transport system substrate-binding protein
MRKWLVLGCLAVALGAAATGLAAGMINIKGSDTCVNLVQRLAEVYMQKSRVPLAVTGGGSGTGIAALINGTIDVADASREMKAAEVQQAQARGFTPAEFTIAVDGLSIIVNKANPVKQLNTNEVGRIFKGEVTNWSQVGGPDRPITLYGRQSNSGTYVFLQEHVLKGDYSQHMNQMNGNAQIVEAVKRDLSAIGYCGVGYVEREAGKTLTVLKVSKAKGQPAYSPLEKKNVDSGAYPISRGLYQYTKGKPAGAVRDFVVWELSPAGQKVVAEEGFFTVGKAAMARNMSNLK